MKTILCWLKSKCIQIKDKVTRSAVYIKVLVDRLLRSAFIFVDKRVVSFGSWINAVGLCYERKAHNPGRLLSKGSRRYRALEFYAAPDSIDLAYYDLMFSYRAYGVKYYIVRRRYEEL